MSWLPSSECTGCYHSRRSTEHHEPRVSGIVEDENNVQILDHLDHQEQHEDLYNFRAITGHQGPLSPQDENYKGSKYNVMVEWEAGEITE